MKKIFKSTGGERDVCTSDPSGKTASIVELLQQTNAPLLDIPWGELFKIDDDEHIVGIVNFQGRIIFATNRRICEIENIGDPKWTDVKTLVEA